MWRRGRPVSRTVKKEQTKRSARKFLISASNFLICNKLNDAKILIVVKHRRCLKDLVLCDCTRVSYHSEALPAEVWSAVVFVLFDNCQCVIGGITLDDLY